MQKPYLGDFNLTEESLKKQQKKRLKWRFIIILLSLLVLVANYRFWLWTYTVIGKWSLLGLFLTFWGLIPAVFSYVLLDTYLGKMFYKGLNRYENAKKQYDQWFVKTQFAFWDALTGRQFEHEVANLLNKAGYSTRVTPASGDKGVDVILTDGTIIQCKAHKSRISPSVARELYGTLQHFRAPRAILISKSGFSKGVYDFIQGKNITLWDINSLIEMQKGLSV
ncbi:MAG: restriction endonuclease [Candidatus Scalindua sp.]